MVRPRGGARPPAPPFARRRRAAGPRSFLSVDRARTGRGAWCASRDRVPGRAGVSLARGDRRRRRVVGLDRRRGASSGDRSRARRLGPALCRRTGSASRGRAIRDSSSHGGSGSCSRTPISVTPPTRSGGHSRWSSTAGRRRDAPPPARDRRDRRAGDPTGCRGADPLVRGTGTTRALASHAGRDCRRRLHPRLASRIPGGRWSRGDAPRAGRRPDAGNSTQAGRHPPRSRRFGWARPRPHVCRCPGDAPRLAQEHLGGAWRLGWRRGDSRRGRVSPPPSRPRSYSYEGHASSALSASLSRSRRGRPRTRCALTQAHVAPVSGRGPDAVGHLLSSARPTGSAVVSSGAADAMALRRPPTDTARPILPARREIPHRLR